MKFKKIITLLSVFVFAPFLMGANSSMNFGVVGQLGGFQGTNPVAYTTTFTSWGTVSTQSFRWSRIGAYMLVQGSWTAGTVAGALARFELPTGYVAASWLPANTSVGTYVSGTQLNGGAFPIISGGSGTVQFGYVNSASGSITPANANVIANNSTLSTVTIMVPIEGWSVGGGGITSAAARAHNSATSISGSLATIVWTTEDWDTNSALSAGVFTCPAIGYYSVEASLAISGTIALNSSAVIEIQKNGSAFSNRTLYAGGAQTNLSPSISDTVYCSNTSDTFRIQASSSATLPAIVSSDSRNYFAITKISN